MSDTTVYIRDAANEQDFETIFKDFFPRLSAFAYKYLKDFDSSKEVVHDVFIKFWEKRSGLDQDKPLKSYLFTAVHNRCLNYIRDNKKFDTNVEVGSEKLNMTAGHDQQKHMEAAELQGKINQILAGLPEKCRMVFQLSRMEGKKYKEIAEELDISQKTVETHMSKALKVLRAGLSDYIKFAIVFMGLNELFKNLF